MVLASITYFHRTLLSIALIAFLVSNSTYAQQAGDNDPSFNLSDLGHGTGTGNFVYATALQSDGRSLIGGGFTTYNGEKCQYLARIKKDGTFDATFNQGGTGANGGIGNIIVQPDDKIIITGGFTSYNNIPRNQIARLNADGTLDPTFDPGTGPNNTNLYSVNLQTDGKLIIGGWFTSYNGTPVKALARLNSDGTLDPTLNPGVGPDGIIMESIVQPDGKIIISGNFFNYAGIPSKRIARINQDGTYDSTFIVGSGLPAEVTGFMLQPDGKIIIGGTFQSYNNIPRNNIIRLNIDGSIDYSFSVGAGTGHAASIDQFILLPDNKIIVAGSFTSFNWTPRAYIARIHSNGALDLSFSPGYGGDSGILSASRQADGKIVIGGTFSTYNNEIPASLVRLNSDGTQDKSYNISQGANKPVGNILVQADGKIIITGSFTRFNNVKRNYFARLHPDGSLDSAYNPGVGLNGQQIMNYAITDMVLQPDGKLVMCGQFSSLTGPLKTSVARLNVDGSVDASFIPPLGTYNSTSNGGTPYAIALQSDGKIIVGGTYYNSSGVPSYSISRLNTDGTVDMSFTGFGIGGDIWNIIVQPDDKIIVSGQFSYFNNTYCSNLLRLNSNGTLDTSFTPNPGTDYVIRASALQADGKIVIGGGFGFYNGVYRWHIARVNSDGSLDQSFDPGVGPDSEVLAIAVQADGKIIIGGYFLVINGTYRKHLARLNANGTLDASFKHGTGTDGDLFATVLQPDGRLLIGGRFIRYKGVARNHIARVFTQTSTASITTGTVSTSSLCAGSTFNISFTSAAAFAPGNIFTAQLSDALGSFLHYTVIGSLATTGSGAISVTIPANVASGSGYRIRVIASAPGAIGSTNGTNLTIIAKPNIIATASMASLCLGSSVTLTASGATNFNWLAGNGLPAQNGTSVTFTPTIAGTLSYKVVGSNGSCTDTSTVTIVVNPLPAVTVVASASQVCPGGSTILTASGADSFLWSNGQTGNSITVSPVTSTAYTVTGTSNGCTSTGTVNVSVTQAPIISASASAATVCAGESITLNATGGTTYNWNNGQSGNSITVTPATSTVYIVTGTNNGCSGTDTIAITVNPIPSVTATSSLAAICIGQTVTLLVSGASAYTWSNGQTGSSITVSPVATTTYYVTGSANNCTSEDSVTITVHPLPVVTSANLSECEGNSAALTANGPAGATYSWSGPNGFTSTAQNPNLGNLTAAMSGNYTVSATLNACTSQATAVVSVLPAPVASFSYQLAACGCAVTISNTSANGQSYSYDFGDGSPVSTAENPSHQYAASGSYTITQTVTSADGCTATSTQTVGVIMAAQNDQSQTFKLYPNPSSGKIILDLAGEVNQTALVEVVNTLGQTVYSRTIMGGSTQEMNLTGLANGAYLVRILQEKMVLNRQLLIQH